jgi:hypothetical protein
LTVEELYSKKETNKIYLGIIYNGRKRTTYLERIMQLKKSAMKNGQPTMEEIMEKFKP